LNIKKYIIFFLLILIFFAYHRLHYFFIHEYDILRISSDSSWWWIIQNWIQQEGFGFNSSSIKDRILFRLPTDIYWQEFIVYLSDFFNINLLKTNIIISSIVFIILSISIFALSFRLLNNFYWSFLSLFCIMNTSYSLFIRYPIVPAKVWGFILFPVILIFILNIIERNRSYFISFFLLIVSMITYFISFSYFVIPLSLATLYSSSINRSNNLNYFKKQIIFWIALLVLSILVMVVLKGGKNVFEASPVVFTELFYQNHKLNLFNISIIFISSSSSIFGLLVSYYLIRKFDYSHKIYFSFLSIITILLFIISLVGLILANFFDVFRSLWFWRSAYFMGLPATLCFMIGLKFFYSNSNFYKIKKIIITTFIISFYFIFSIISRQAYYNKPTTAIGWYLYNDHEASILENINLEELINYSNDLKVEDFLILPPLKMQNINTDIFEANSNLPVILSRGDHPHLIYKTDRTINYSETIIKYNKILDMNDNILKSEFLKNFLNDKNVSHILVPNEKIFNWIKLDPKFVVTFKNEKWLIIKSK